MQLGGRWFNPRVNLPRHRPLVCGLSLEVDITAGAVLIVLEPEEILIWIYLLKLDFNQLWACNFGSQELGSSSCSPRGHTVELIRTCFPALILTCCASWSIGCIHFWFCLKIKCIRWSLKRHACFKGCWSYARMHSSSVGQKLASIVLSWKIGQPFI